MKELNEMERAVIFCYAAALLDILFTGIGIATGVAGEGNPLFAWMPFPIMIPSMITVSFIPTIGGLAIIPYIEKFNRDTPNIRIAFLFSTIFYLKGVVHLVMGAGGWYYLFRCVGYFA